MPFHAKRDLLRMGGRIALEQQVENVAIAFFSLLENYLLRRIGIRSDWFRTDECR